MAQRAINNTQVKRYAREYVQYLARVHRVPIREAYLFGSFAKKRPRAWSDVDVCIVSEKFRRIDPLPFLWTRRRDIDIERGIEPYGIHPDDFVDDNPIAYEVKKHGIIL